jgi:hypothetical protein
MEMQNSFIGNSNLIQPRKPHRFAGGGRFQVRVSTLSNGIGNINEMMRNTGLLGNVRVQCLNAVTFGCIMAACTIRNAGVLPAARLSSRRKNG